MLNDGSESRRTVKALPETTAPNGPPSCKVKATVVTALAVEIANEFATTLTNIQAGLLPL